MGVGMLGCGTVGASVLRLIEQGGETIHERVGGRVEVRRVLVRDLDKPREGVDASLLTTDPESVLGDEDIDIVVELVGGEQPAKSFIERALDQGKSVVTANKLLIATHGPELLARAVAAQADLAFEGAVGGGIPIVRTLRDAFASDRLTAVTGILNGTSNYVLTRMLDAGLSFADATAEAQQLGYAEADPSMDVDGHDAAHKLGILAMLGFGLTPGGDPMHVEGIRAIEPVDHRFAARFGYRIKHLVVGRDHGESVELRTHPALVPERSVLANVDGALNAVLLEGEALGPSLVYGQGAGGMPTAVSVLSDVLDVARSIAADAPGLQTRGIRHTERPRRAMADVESRYYIRFRVLDRPGVMAQIATALGEHEVSIEQMLQDRLPEVEGGPADVVMLTHRAREAEVQAALEALKGSAILVQAPRLMRIQDV
jgi:homoserine dehydrogenase